MWNDAGMKLWSLKKTKQTDIVVEQKKTTQKCSWNFIPDFVAVQVLFCKDKAWKLGEVCQMKILETHTLINWKVLRALV